VLVVLAREGEQSNFQTPIQSATMSSNGTETQVVPVVKKPKKLKPARKQVKPGDVEKKEAVQTGKEYSEFYWQAQEEFHRSYKFSLDIWYNKWAGGDREDSYSKSVS
jgi:hypothetical protein